MARMRIYPKPPAPLPPPPPPAPPPPAPPTKEEIERLIEEMVAERVSLIALPEQPAPVVIRGESIKGDKGDSIEGQPGRKGDKGDSIKGDTGPRGQSEYEIAVELGFKGDKREWLRSREPAGGMNFGIPSTQDVPDGYVLAIDKSKGYARQGKWTAPASGGGSDASEITYHGDYPTVEAALDALFAVAMEIESYTGTTAGAYEAGDTVANITLNWTLSKTPLTLSISNGVGSLPVSQTSQLVTGPFTTDQTWTLTADDGLTSDSADVSILFQLKRYYGASALTSLSNSDILALGNELSTGLARTVVYDCTGGKYPYYVWPQTYGNLSLVTINNLSFSDYTITQQSVTNAHGHVDTYNVLRFNGIQTGSNIIVVFA